MFKEILGLFTSTKAKTNSLIRREFLPEDLLKIVTPPSCDLNKLKPATYETNEMAKQRSKGYRTRWKIQDKLADRFSPNRNTSTKAHLRNATKFTTVPAERVLPSTKIIINTNRPPVSIDTNKWHKLLKLRKDQRILDLH